MNLAIPALVNIYRGLNKISMVRNLNKLEAIFLSDYVYGWLRTYFKTYCEHPCHPRSLPKMFSILGEKMNQTSVVLEAQELLKC